MKKKAKKKALDLNLPIFQIKISLDGIEPLIWRRVEVDDRSLHGPHEIIQRAMDGTACTCMPSRSKRKTTAISCAGW